MKDKFYGLFVGQNATTGSPNTKTGRLSIFGDILRFDSDKTRQHYLDTHLFGVNERLIILGGKNIMRHYCLGMDMHSFVEHLGFLGAITMSDLNK